MFALQNAPLGQHGPARPLLRAPGGRAAFTRVRPRAERLGVRRGSLACSFIYSAELFDRRHRASGSAGSLEALLRGAAADDGRRLSELPLLTEAARHQLAVEWNDTRPAAVAAERAARGSRPRSAAAPDAVALEAGEERLTYAELDRRANRLAHRLRRLGVGPGEAVGLFAERSAEMVTGLLAIWKAGGAYLPLDPGAPAGAPGLPAGGLRGAGDRGRRRARGSAAAEPGADRASRRRCLEEESDPPPDGPPGPGDLAYRIYTSGTTGGPKAVLVEHGTLAGTLAAAQEAFGFRPGDRMPCIASFSFDIFLFELLGPLLAGGTCVLLPLRPTLDLERLLGELDTATHLHAVPALMRQVLELARRRGTRRRGCGRCSPAATPCRRTCSPICARPSRGRRCGSSTARPRPRSSAPSGRSRPRGR